MLVTKYSVLTKVHLIISILVVVPVAIVYGFNLEVFLDLNHNTIDEKNFSKSIMYLYLGFSTLWVLGIFKAKYFKVALITNMVFMLSLALGRCFSIIIDGLPSQVYCLGAFGELILACYGLWVLKQASLK